jgi:hypothetical protein
MIALTPTTATGVLGIEKASDMGGYSFESDEKAANDDHPARS